MLKPLRLWTCVWGDKHLDWFKRYAIRSLSFEKNRQAIEGATWAFLTTGEDRPKIEAMMTAAPFRLRDIEYIILGPEFKQNPHAAGAFLNQGFQIEINHSITYGAQTLIAPPDTIWGDGSVAHMREMARQRDSVVFAVHVRTLPEIENEIKDNMTNAQLVGAAFKHLHATWEHAQDGLEKVNSYIGGVLWRYLSENLYGATHRLPTPYLINFTPEDLVYFRNQLHFGVLDHSWPNDCLIDTERMRLCGSSDTAFMVEITEAQNNIPPVAAYHAGDADHFWRNLKHNKINRMFSVTLRGEP
jgi:hypothetical protein